MNCPYCEREMEQGYLKSFRHMVWSHSPRMPLISCPGTIPIVEDDDVEVGKAAAGGWNGFRVQASYCPGCKKIIIDT